MKFTAYSAAVAAITLLGGCSPAGAQEAMCPAGQVAVCAAPAARAPEPPPVVVPPVVPPPPPPASGVLFQDGFENGLVQWDETARQAKIVCDDGQARTGRCALLVDQPALGWGGELGEDFGAREQVYLSVWWKFPGAIPPHTAGGHFWRLGSAPRGEPQLDTQIDGGKMTPVMDWGTEIPYWGAVALPTGRWFRHEVLFRLNTPGRADGVFRVWTDGVLVVDKTGQAFRPGASAPIRRLRLVTNYDNCPTAGGCRWLFDDLVVRDSRP